MNPKTVYSLTLLALAASACNQVNSSPETSTTAPATAVQSTMPAASQAPKKGRVTGSFGFTLGEPIPLDLDLGQDEDGRPLQRIPNRDGDIAFTAKQPIPTRFGKVSVDQNGSVYRIFVVIFGKYLVNTDEGSPLMVEKLHELEAATLLTLRDKYGLSSDSTNMNDLDAVIKFPTEGVKDFIFGARPRTVTVSLFRDLFTISYKDAELKSKHDAWEEAQKAAALHDKLKEL